MMALVWSAFFFTTVSAAATLGAAAATSGRVFGTAVSSSHLSDSSYVSTWDTEFTGFTPENEMKWDTTEPSQNAFQFSAADTLVSHAQQRNMKIRGHTLVWHNQLPSWVSSLSSSSTLLSVMNNHITTEMTHFQGKIWYWDVVNEAFNDDGTRRSDVFQHLLGNSYIETAFRTAHAADPNAKLCYNDCNYSGLLRTCRRAKERVK
jgi:endo-1,4-beta-xylanase